MLKKYMAREADEYAESAILVFANNAVEARKLAYYSYVFNRAYIDIRVRQIKGHEYLDKMYNTGEPRVVRDILSCKICERWGGGELNEDGICPECLEEIEEEGELND
jgi:hypothetical protein